MDIQYKILIAEDDADFCGFLEKLLSCKGYRVLTATNGRQALDYVKEEVFDIALLDVRLPDIDGYMIMDRILAGFSKIPVIMMTGNASIDSAVKALKNGAYDYLEKPFATEKLLNTLQNALERKRLETQSKKALEKLGESEKKYHQLFDCVTDALVIFDTGSRKFEDANAAALKLFGYSIEEFCNLQIEGISAEKDKSMNTVEILEKGEQDSRFVPLRYLRKKDGTIFPVELSAASFTSGGRHKIIGSILDITERQQRMEELNTTKKRLQHLLSSSPVVIYAVDPAADFAATFVSDNIKTLLGYDPEEYVGDPKFWVDRLHPDDAPYMMSWMSHLMEKGWQVSEYRFRHKDGSYRWLHDELRMIYDAQGAPKEVVGSSIDITERVNAENELRESEERYRQLFDCDSDAVFVFDYESLNIEEVNRAALDLFGYSKSEALKKSILVMSAEKEKTFGNIQIAKNSKSPNNRIPLRYFRRKDGSVFPGDVSSGAFHSGGRLKAIGSIRDISSRVLVEKRLRESKERFRILVENSLIGISIIQDHKFVYQNQIQNQLYGPIRDRTIFEASNFIHPDDLAKIKKAYKNVLSGKLKTVEADFRFYRHGKNGSRSDLHWVQCRATPLSYRGKNAILVNSVDITEAKQLEHQLIIKNKMLSLGRVAAGIAHEIRNPLTGINSYLYTLAELCRSEPIESEDIELMHQIVGQIQVASNKIESVIKRVMDFSKPGAPKMVLSDINESLAEAVELSAVTLRKNDIKLEKALANNLPQCHIDPQLIEQVMLNLITNAAKAMQNGGGTKTKIIEVRSYSKDNSVCIGVSDSGPGVPRKLRDKIFDPFFTTKEDGQGIGLNIAQRIIADHNGSLSLDSSDLGGAEFRIELPVEKRMEPR
jgi:PAS domain S-box-containing protein